MVTYDDVQYRNYAIVDGLSRILRDELTEKFTAEAKPIIDRAVTEAMASMKLGVESWKDMEYQREVIHAVIEDKRLKDVTGRDVG